MTIGYKIKGSGVVADVSLGGARVARINSAGEILSADASTVFGEVVLTRDEVDEIKALQAKRITPLVVVATYLGKAYKAWPVKPVKEIVRVVRTP